MQSIIAFKFHPLLYITHISKAIKNRLVYRGSDLVVISQGQSKCIRCNFFIKSLYIKFHTEYYEIGNIVMILTI